MWTLQKHAKEVLEKDQGGSVIHPGGGYDGRLFAPPFEWRLLVLTVVPFRLGQTTRCATYWVSSVQNPLLSAMVLNFDIKHKTWTADSYNISIICRDTVLDPEFIEKAARLSFYSANSTVCQIHTPGLVFVEE